MDPIQQEYIKHVYETNKNNNEILPYIEPLPYFAFQPFQFLKRIVAPVPLFNETSFSSSASFDLLTHLPPYSHSTPFSSSTFPHFPSSLAFSSLSSSLRQSSGTLGPDSSSSSSSSSLSSSLRQSSGTLGPDSSSSSYSLYSELKKERKNKKRKSQLEDSDEDYEEEEDVEPVGKKEEDDQDEYKEKKTKRVRHKKLKTSSSSSSSSSSQSTQIRSELLKKMKELQDKIDQKQADEPENELKNLQKDLSQYNFSLFSTTMAIYRLSLPKLTAPLSSSSSSSSVHRFQLLHKSAESKMIFVNVQVGETEIIRFLMKINKNLNSSKPPNSAYYHAESVHYHAINDEKKHVKVEQTNNNIICSVGGEVRHSKISEKEKEKEKEKGKESKETDLKVLVANLKKSKAKGNGRPLKCNIIVKANEPVIFTVTVLSFHHV